MCLFPLRPIRLTCVLIVITALWQIPDCAAEKFSALKSYTSATTSASQAPAFPAGSLVDYHPKQCPGYVYTRNGHFYLNGRLFDFRSLNAPEFLTGTAFEVTDTARSIAGFATPVTRSYTLQVANEVFGGSQKASSAHIIGWDASRNDWIYNEKQWAAFDKALDIAAREGIKLIFPIINQDYGKVDSDFVGNFNDLIRHRYNITSYTDAQTAVDWFVDQSIRNEFKKIIRYVLTRRNTVNGKTYGYDDTFLAFETGNEMNWAQIQPTTNMTNLSMTPTTANVTRQPANLTHTRPAPAEWTIDIARYIKGYAPNTLVMDGSYARNKDVTQAFPEESLRSPYIDIFSYHFYGDSDLDGIQAYQARVESFGKTFIIGEHGFYSNGAAFDRFYRNFRGAGSLIWSLRPHSEVSGFATHSEDNNIYSYHVPGWQNQTAKDFDQNEYSVIRLTYKASYDALGLSTPPYPIPGPPHPFFATNGSATGLSFKGAAWAERYEIWAASIGGVDYVKVGENVFDNVDRGDLFFAIDPTRLTAPMYIPPLIKITYIVPQTGWVDKKWGGLVWLPPWPRRSVQLPFQKRHHEETSFSKISAFHSKIRRSHHDHSLKAQVKRSAEPTLDKRGFSSDGGWVTVRGISVDGKAGYFSQPAFISASEAV